MVNILGIDYGTKNIGIALATTSLAEPLTILENSNQTISEIIKIATQESISKIIIGLSEGQMAQATKNFATQLEIRTNITIKFHDETLTSVEAKNKLSHTKKTKRADPQDAFQAAVMLQDFLDTHPSRQLPKS